MTPLRIFIGYDHRQPLAYNVLQHSLLSRSSVPLSITPLVLSQLPITRQGLTPFTFSRFLVPWLCNFRGRALFLDSDFLCLADIAQLFSLADDTEAVQLVRGRHRFEWTSMMLFNCFHSDNTRLTPDLIEHTHTALHQAAWTSCVGVVPSSWNHLVGYDPPRSDARLVHFTQGLPIFEETRGSEYTEEWETERLAMFAVASWPTLMGRSVHATTDSAGRPVARLHPDAKDPS